MSRASTTLHILLATMLLVSLVPATTAVSDPATDDQEASIDAVDGVDVPNTLPWTVKNELHVLHMNGNALTYSAGASGKQDIAGGVDGSACDDNLGGTQAGGACDALPAGPAAAVFTLGQTVAQSEITSFATSVFIQTNSATTVKVELLANGTAIDSLSIPITGVLINTPSNPTPVPVPFPQSAPTEFTASKVTSKVLPPLTTLAVRVSATSDNPANTVTLYRGGSTDSRVTLTADTSRIKAWTEKDLVPGVVQSNFASPANADSGERTLRVLLAHLQAFNNTAQNALPVVFQILASDGKVVFDSSGSPIGVNAANNQRWGSSATLPSPDLLPTVDGVVVQTYRLTYPNTLTPGNYKVHLCAKTCAATGSIWTLDLPVNIGASDGAFEVAANEVADKTILVGQRTTFRLSLRNPGDVEDTYALQTTVGALRPGWTASITPTQVRLAPGGSTDVELTVIPAANGGNGDENTVRATATSLLSGSSFELDKVLHVKLTNVRESGVEILNATNSTVANPEPTLRLTISPGGHLAVPVIVQNLGNGFDRMVVSLTGAPAGWTSSASPALLELGARSQAPTILTIEAPANAVPSSGFLLTMKASRLDNLTQADTQAFRIVVAEIDSFTFEALDNDRDRPIASESSVQDPIIHNLRDEGPDASTVAGEDKWNGAPQGDKDFDDSGLFRLVLTNTGSRADTYQLTPYVLTAGGSTAAALAGDVASTGTNRTTLGFRDSNECDGSAAGRNDGKNDGWIMRMYKPGEAAPFATTSQSFAEVLDGQKLSVAVPAKGSAVVYVEMKWYVPAGAGCPVSTRQVGDADDTERATDPAFGHAVLVEAVSSSDASHRATHVLNARLTAAGDFAASQRYDNTVNEVVVLAEPGETLSHKVTTETGGRTTTFHLRGVNFGNEVDAVSFEVPQFNCPTSSSSASSCWENTISSTLDRRGMSANTAAANGAGTCSTPNVSNPSATSLNTRKLTFTCVMGVFDEVGFDVTTSAPASGVIGQANTVTVTMRASQASHDDTIALGAAITGEYALDVLTTAVTPALIHPGQTTAIPFTVRNLGTNEDNVTVDLRDTLPTGWSGDFSVPNPVFVPAGRAVDVLLFATAPASATVSSATPKFEVRATSGDSPAVVRPTDNVTLGVKVVPKSSQLNLTAEPSNVLTMPGQMVNVTVKATRNTSTATTARFFVDPSSVPLGWSATLEGASAGIASTTFSNGVATANLRITPPADALGTSRAAIRVLVNQTATGNFGSGDEFTHVGVSLSSPNLGVELSAPDGTTVLVAPGSATPMRLTVENLGVAQDVITLTTGTLPTGWNAVFAAENITLQPLQTRTIDVTVTAPADLVSGQSRLLTFIATTADGVRSDIVQVNFTSGNSVLVLSSNVVGTRHVLPLEPLTFTVTVNNTGDLPDDIVMRAALGGSFKDVVTMAFDPATFSLEAGQARDVTVTVTLPAGLAPNLDVPLAIEAASKGPFLKSVGVTTVVAKVLDHKVRDVDADRTDEYAIDRDLNPANGYEEFRDPSVGGGISKAVDAATFLSTEAKARLPSFVFDPDGDRRTDLLVDLDADGKPDVYWDPDRGYSHVIPLVKDVTKDGREDYFFDLDGEAGFHLDVFYDPLQGTTGRLLQVDIDNNGVLDYVVDANGNGNPDPSETVLFNGPDGKLASIRETADVDGDGKADTVIDTDADGKPDYFLPNGKTAAVPIVLEDINGDGIDDWTFDSNGDGRRDSYYDPATQETAFINAKGGFMDDLAKYWYVGALFGVVLVLFVVLLLVTRR